MKTIIDKEVYLGAKKYLKKIDSNAVTIKKLQCVMASYHHGVTKVAKVFNVSRDSIRKWGKKIKDKDFEDLINKRKLQDGIKLKRQHKKKISQWLSETPSLTIKEISRLLKEQCNLEVSIATTHRAMVSCGYSYITPRKQHYKQDKKKVEAFKKGAA